MFGIGGGGWGFIDYAVVVLAVLVALGAGFYFLNRWANRRYSAQQDMVAKNKQAAKIFVIDKKQDKAANVNLPKAIIENLPRTAKMMKMNFVKAKVGPQIVTLMCDKNIYEHIDLKKDYHVELAGIYIVSVKGAKTKFEKKEAGKAKKKMAKEKNKAEKAK
ncbi:MAG: hypothetical protein FWC67_00900 [Defluviitaleaceae bacterium]|nr:hypothetical protein [Defluviitaleaceae bacterium]